MLTSTLLTPKELHSDLVFLRSRGFQSSDLSRLHHLSRDGRTVSLAQVIGYFAERKALRGSNIELAVRCHYVAEQVRAGHANLRPLVAEALKKWPLARATKSKAAAKSKAATKSRKAESTTRLRTAAKRRKKR
jgi:hypothetical protein